MDNNNASLYNDAMYNSDIQKRANALYDQVTSVFNAVMANKDRAHLCRTMAAHFESLSEDDHKILFSVHVNGFTMRGEREYSSLADYIDHLEAGAAHEEAWHREHDGDVKPAVGGTATPAKTPAPAAQTGGKVSAATAGHKDDAVVASLKAAGAMDAAPSLDTQLVSLFTHPAVRARGGDIQSTAAQRPRPGLPLSYKPGGLLSQTV